MIKAVFIAAALCLMACDEASPKRPIHAVCSFPELDEVLISWIPWSEGNWDGITDTGEKIQVVNGSCVFRFVQEIK